MARWSQRIHDVSPREHLDRISFVLAFVLGAGGSIALKFLGLPPLLVAGYAALILVLYAIVAWGSGRIRLEPETIGDNCYYLGFLFTLASLAFTLYQMAKPTLNDSTPVDIPVVISGFGVALSSTIVGVFLRVLMMQLRPDFVTKDREVRADINRAFADFRKSMSGILRQMKAFSAESVQMAAERDKRINQSAEKALADHQAALLRSTELFTEHLETTLFKSIEDNLKNMATSIVNSNKETQVAVAEACRAIVEMKEELVAQENTSFSELKAHRERTKAQLIEEDALLKSRSDEMQIHIRTTQDATTAMAERMVPALDALSQQLDTLRHTLEASSPGTPPPSRFKTREVADD